MCGRWDPWTPPAARQKLPRDKSIEHAVPDHRDRPVLARKRAQAIRGSSRTRSSSSDWLFGPAPIQPPGHSRDDNPRGGRCLHLQWRSDGLCESCLIEAGEPRAQVTAGYRRAHERCGPAVPHKNDLHVASRAQSVKTVSVRD